MGQNSFGQSKSYDRLRVPMASDRRRGNLSPDYTDTVRRIEMGRGRSQTLQYRFDFSRPSGSTQSGRKRLSAAPDIVPATVRDGRVQSTSKPSKADVRSKENALSKRPETRSHSAASQKAAHGRNRGVPKKPGRPASASVTDFQSVGTNKQNVSGSSIKAPRLGDDVAGALSENRYLTTGRTSALNAMPDTTARHARAERESAERVAGKYRPVSRPNQTRPVKPSLNPARGASDQSASTVVGLDISRSVFEKTPMKVYSKEESPAIKPKPRRAGPRFRTVLTAILMIGTIFGILAFSLMLSARVSDVSRKNTQLEKDNDRIESEIKRVEMQIALEEDLSNVKERATELGMVLPEEDQIQYVELEEDH